MIYIKSNYNKIIYDNQTYPLTIKKIKGQNNYKVIDGAHRVYALRIVNEERKKNKQDPIKVTL